MAGERGFADPAHAVEQQMRGFGTRPIAIMPANGCAPANKAFLRECQLADLHFLLQQPRLGLKRLAAVEQYRLRLARVEHWNAPLLEDFDEKLMRRFGSA
ncbi:hypothetical protein L6R21_19530 [bacterium]|nr:hypothetical protein [bacterium]